MSALVSSTAEEESLLLDLSLVLVVFSRPHSSAIQSALNLLPAIQYRKKFMALKEKCYNKEYCEECKSFNILTHKKVILRENARGVPLAPYHALKGDGARGVPCPGPGQGDDTLSRSWLRGGVPCPNLGQVLISCENLNIDHIRRMGEGNVSTGVCLFTPGEMGVPSIWFHVLSREVV